MKKMTLEEYEALPIDQKYTKEEWDQMLEEAKSGDVKMENHECTIQYEIPKDENNFGGQLFFHCWLDNDKFIHSSFYFDNLHNSFDEFLSEESEICTICNEKLSNIK